jgi:hypothetical protein
MKINVDRTMTPATLPKLDPAAIRVQLSLSQEKHLPLKDADVRARLAKLQEIATLGLMVYSGDGLREFLTTPLPVFNGYTAIDLMLIGEYDRVIGALAADFEGLGY